MQPDPTWLVLVQPPPDIVPVEVTTRWLDWVLFGVQLLSVIAAGAAAVLAYITIRQAKRQARAHQDALVRERRIDFELDVMADLAEYNERGDSVAGAGARFRTLASLLSADLVPLSRAAVGLESTQDAEETARASSTPGESKRRTMRNEIAAEIREAIQTRLNERH